MISFLSGLNKFMTHRKYACEFYVRFFFIDDHPKLMDKRFCQDTMQVFRFDKKKPDSVKWFSWLSVMYIGYFDRMCSVASQRFRKKCVHE